MEIDKAIEKAINYVLPKRDEKGLWEDFSSRYGGSIDWVSSYTALALLNLREQQSDLEITTESLAKRQINGGWGYNNDTFSPDADSTAFGIILLSRFGYKDEVRRAKEFLLKHQKENGGFSTFTPESVSIDPRTKIFPGTSVEGWCSPTPDITATALKAIPDNPKALNYLVQNQLPDGSWRTYWYNNDIYSTTQAIKSISGKNLDDVVRLAQKWLSQQKTDVPFYKALQLQGLIGNAQYLEKAKNKVSQLLESQKEDGSWESRPLIRVPFFSNIEPWKDQLRLRDDMNDQNRIFTTATCLETLVLYRKLKS
jgi:sporulenol synthase